MQSGLYCEPIGNVGGRHSEQGPRERKDKICRKGPVESV
jgi:hypothetical protein